MQNHKKIKKALPKLAFLLSFSRFFVSLAEDFPQCFVAMFRRKTN